MNAKTGIHVLDIPPSESTEETLLGLLEETCTKLNAATQQI